MASLIRRHYTRTNPETGKKVRKTAKKWYVAFTDEMRLRRSFKLAIRAS